MRPDGITPAWSLPAGVAALCTTRAGGVSAGFYASLNLGDHVGDRAQDVATNRARFSAAVQARPVFLQQVHGSDAVLLRPELPDGIRADACVTRERGLACTVMVADCLPVLLCSEDGAVVAAAHAGWRGLAGDAQGWGVLESALALLCAQVAGTAQPLLSATIAMGTRVWLGPCIGPRQFEVGPEVREAFVRSDSQACDLFSPSGPDKYRADLAGLARRRLERMGVRHIDGNDGSEAWCTVGNPSRFFSHRRDSARLGGSGRFAAAIWRL